MKRRHDVSKVEMILVAEREKDFLIRLRRRRRMTRARVETNQKDKMFWHDVGHGSSSGLRAFKCINFWIIMAFSPLVDTVVKASVLPA